MKTRRPTKGRLNLVAKCGEHFFLADDRWLKGKKWIPFLPLNRRAIHTPFLTLERQVSVLVTKVFGSNHWQPVWHHPAADSTFCDEIFIVYEVDPESPLRRLFTEKHWQQIAFSEQSSRFDAALHEAVSALVRDGNTVVRQLSR